MIVGHSLNHDSLICGGGEPLFPNFTQVGKKVVMDKAYESYEPCQLVFALEHRVGNLLETKSFISATKISLGYLANIPFDPSKFTHRNTSRYWPFSCLISAAV